ncbi:hypothetical protein [Nitrosomonas sp. Is37]|uniref:hypothetical protein n=1 Tax=Nitrosomonas sp. Is37 TaxID=3080535 RepID=UPI00294B8A1B|nr:hypothetical protein [Nitrosomonas sp. Is37]MDV6345560.1 hypothetical protein [Nitrosomonas sp. Is37]
MKKLQRSIKTKSNPDYTAILNQFCNEKNYYGVLLVDHDTYDDLFGKHRNFVIVPIPKQLNYHDKLIVAPSAIKRETALALEYGSLFVVYDVLENHHDEIEGLQPGYSIIILNYLYQLTDDIVNGKKEPLRFELPPANRLQ